MCWRQSLITSQVKEQPVDMDIIGYLVEPNVRVSEIGADMLLTQGVPYIDREELGLSYISCPLLLRFRGPRHDNIYLYISLYIVDHYLNKSKDTPTCLHTT